MTEVSSVVSDVSLYFLGAILQAYDAAFLLKYLHNEGPLTEHELRDIHFIKDRIPFYTPDQKNFSPSLRYLTDEKLVQIDHRGRYELTSRGIEASILLLGKERRPGRYSHEPGWYSEV